MFVSQTEDLGAFLRVHDGAHDVEVRWRGDLDVRVGAFHLVQFVAVVQHKGRRVDEVEPPPFFHGLVVCVMQLAEAEALRGAGELALLAVDDVGEHAVLALHEGLGCGYDGDGAAVLLHTDDAGGDGLLVDQRPDTVMNDDVRFRWLQSVRLVDAVADRLLPG